MTTNPTYSHEDALSVERLEDLRPPWDEHFGLPYRARVWYNEAVETATALLIEAAEQNDEFRRAFIAEEKEMVDAFPNDDEHHQVESDVWRTILEEEMPELHEDLHSIGLSAFQGGTAEGEARRALRE